MLKYWGGGGEKNRTPWFSGPSIQVFSIYDADMDVAQGEVPSHNCMDFYFGVLNTHAKRYEEKKSLESQTD